MTRVGIDWERGAWTTSPLRASHEEGRLVVEAVEGSDFWAGTLYGFQHDNGHALLAPWSAARAVEVSFSLTGFSGLYDQAGLMLRHDALHWIKAGIEVNDDVPHLAVVVTDTYSDWSLAPAPEWKGQEVTVRASSMNDAVIIRARVAGAAWRTLRVARFVHGEGTQAGPFLCAPTRAGLTVTFTGWEHTDPDSDLHGDPPG